MNAMIDDLKLAYDDDGSGPTVLLIHGFPLDRRMWREQATALAQGGYRVIVPDLRGFGASHADDSSFTLSTHADDIVKLMNYLGIGRAVMVGASSGSTVVLEMLAKYPRRVAATCLLAPPVSAQSEDERLRFLAIEELARSGQRRAAINGLCQELLPNTVTLASRGLASDIRQWIESSSPNALAHTMSACTRRLNWQTIQARCTVPLLTLFGEHDTIAPPPTDATFEHYVIKGGGHLFNMECASAVNARLLAFLDQLNSAKPRDLGQVAIAA